MTNRDTSLCFDCVNSSKMKPRSQDLAQTEHNTPDGLRILARLIARQIIFRRHASKAKTFEKTNNGENISRP